jgi:cob(I)alamin adenosyltransferase
VSDADTTTLERATDDLASAAGGFGGFSLPGGGETGARLHVARTVVRRAERRVTALSAEAGVDPLALSFLNRLSDALFAAALYANMLDGAAEETWDAGFKPPTP